MVRVAVVVCIALVACDRGKPSHQQPPPAARDATVAPSDAPPPIDAGVVDAEVVDAIVLAPPKPAAAQKRDCVKAAKRIGTSFGGDNREKRETDAATAKAC